MESRSAPPPAAALPAAASGNADGHGSTAASSSSSPSSSLHAVRKLPAKPWKKPTAAAHPPRPKVYRVDPRGFRLLVQSLTGATEPAPRSQLRDASPAQLPHMQLGRAPMPPKPPQQYLPASSSHDQVEDGRGRLASSSSALESVRGFLHAEVPSGETTQTKKSDGGHRGEDHTAVSTSPSIYSSAYLSWCNLPLLSPGTMEFGS